MARNIGTNVDRGGVALVPAGGTKVGSGVLLGLHPRTTLDGTLAIDGIARFVGESTTAFQVLGSDPVNPLDGDSWYRPDTDEVMIRGNGSTRGIITRSVYTLTDDTTIAVNAANGNHFRVTLAGNRTMGPPSNPLDGQKIVFEIIQDGTGSRTMAWDAVYAFGTDVTSPTMTTTASKRDFVGFVYNATAAKWYCLAVSKGY